MKKKFLSVFLLFTMVMSLVGCGRMTDETVRLPQEQDTEESVDVESEEVIDEDVVEISLVTPDSDLYKFDFDASHLFNMSSVVDACYAGENLMVSPLSLDIALAMSANGADDETKLSYEKYFGKSLDDVNDFYKTYLTELPSVIEIANGMFLSDNYTVQDTMNDILTNYYLGEIKTLDFTNDESIGIVNQWCADATHDMIPAVVDSLDSSDLLLANALYFKDKWHETITDVEENAPFMNVNGEEEYSTMLNFMSDTYFESNYATGFCYDYSTDGYGLITILPKESGDFNLSEIDIDDFMSSMTNEYKVIAKMPEFNFSNNFNMMNVLSSMGLNSLTSGSYTNMVNEEDLSISDMIQYAKVDVNRDGTEAAAVTVMSMKVTSLPDDEPKYQTVYCDRPFAFMIYDFNNDLPLFIGKVVSVK